ncbi:MAG: tRNA-guanine transglycosylase, partial [Chloroflexi bacterium]|nr:tRNA-guanine transglycosylase [Chloroflexota bacterium]
DMIMTLDECAPYPCDHAQAEKSVERTTIWAKRSKEHFIKTEKEQGKQFLFSIVQGATFEDLRQRSARALIDIGFNGYAIGGVSVGEPVPIMFETLDWVMPLLPEDKPRYLMGVGSPDDIVEGVMRGMDIFDSVLPTRMARNRAALTRKGRINLRNLPYAKDARPIEEECGCYTCRSFSRAYLRHLIVAKEMLASTLLSIHNLRMLADLTNDLRQAIEGGKLENFVKGFRAEYQKHRSPGS